MTWMLLLLLFLAGLFVVGPWAFKRTSNLSRRTPRWSAHALYAGNVVRETQVMEIGELEPWIEMGPDFTTLISLTVSYNDD